MVTSTEQIRSVQYLAASQVERPVINFLIGEARTDSCRPMPKKANDVEPSPFMLVDVADFGLRADVANFVAKWRASCSALRSTGLSPQHIVDILNRSQCSSWSSTTPSACRKHSQNGSGVVATACRTARTVCTVASSQNRFASLHSIL
jgi:hypothetical protein